MEVDDLYSTCIAEVSKEVGYMIIWLRRLSKSLKVDADALQDVLEYASIDEKIEFNGLFIYLHKRRIEKNRSIFSIGIWNGPIEDEKSRCLFNGEVFIKHKTLTKKSQDT